MDLMLILKAVIIAIVEGITEFIPVSSSGHMILVGHFIGFKGEFAKLFEVVIQLGAIMAIVILYWNKLWGSFVKIFKGDKKSLVFWLNIIIGSVPIAICGFAFKKKIDKLLDNPITVAAALVVGGILLIIIENKYRKKATVKNVDDIKIRQAISTGVFQCLALWPGMSRSASTIMGAWVSGISTVAAAEFSFFLAIPAMVGASGVELIQNGGNLTNGEVITLTIGFIVAFLVSVFVVEKFIDFLKKKPMRFFAVYRIFVGVIVLGLALAGILKV